MLLCRILFYYLFSEGSEGNSLPTLQEVVNAYRSRSGTKGDVCFHKLIHLGTRSWFNAQTDARGDGCFSQSCSVDRNNGKDARALVPSFFTYSANRERKHDQRISEAVAWYNPYSMTMTLTVIRTTEALGQATAWYGILSSYLITGDSHVCPSNYVNLN